MVSRYEPNMVTTIEVEPEEYEKDGYKFAKLWLLYVITPESINHKDSCFPAAFLAYDKMKILYKMKK